MMRTIASFPRPLHLAGSRMRRLAAGLVAGLFFIQFLLPGSLVAGETGAAPADDVAEKEKAHKETLNKLNLLGYILNNSKRAKEVRASGNERAVDILKTAHKHYEEARSLLDKGKYADSNIEIQKSLQNISVAFRMVVDKEREAEIASKQYESLYERVRSFSELFNQLPADKVKGILDYDKLNELLKKAESLYAEGKPKQALEPLSSVADMLEQALSDARKNETVVYALEFETPEDEYKYELERNENYTLLTNIIMSNSPKEIKKKLPLIRMLINKNEEMVVEAEKLFEKGDVEEAISLLEKGNKTLVRALRLSGLTL